MRGLDVYNFQQNDILNALLDGLTEEYDFLVKDEEIISDQLHFDSQKPLTSVLKEFKDSGESYYVYFIQIQAFPKGTAFSEIRNYQDYLNSSCEFVLMIIDGLYAEFYAKSTDKILKMIQNFEGVKAEKIEIKTDWSDGRERFELW